MKTLTGYRKAMGLSAVATCIAAAPLHAQETVTVHGHASRQENIGVFTGLALGAVAGGPIGAIVGAAAGAWIGDRYHKEASARAALAVDLDRSQAQKNLLAGNLNELDLALRHTNEVQTDVSFRTNDDAVEIQSLPPLLKIGALAAALPDARVRVSGFADSRGSQSYNETLSRKRAEAVAAVLATAGVPQDRLILEAHGSSESTTADGDVDGYALDRRVSVRIERTDAAAVARND